MSGQGVPIPPPPRDSWLARGWGLGKDLARYLALCARRLPSGNAKEALPLLLQGFAADKAALYSPELRRQRLYLTDLQRERTARINPLRPILNNKLLFESFFGAVAPVARSFALVSAGRVLPLRPEWTDLLSGAGPAQLVVKPVQGNRGRGVRLIALQPDVAVSPVAEAMTLPLLLDQLRQLRGDYLLCEFIEQGRFSARLFPDSVNTLRFVTMREPARGTPFLAAAVQRMGSRSTGCTDNFSAGGFSAPVALESGRLGAAQSRQQPGRLLEHHLDSGIRIEGAVIPEWSGLVERVLQIAQHAPFHYVGWDVVVTDQGFVLLEGNNMPDVDLLQVHAPLLSDARVAAFFRAHGIVGSR